MMNHKLVKLYWMFIILFLTLLKLLSITRADIDFHSNTIAISNESFLWEHLRVGTSNPLDKNLSFSNDRYTFNMTTINDTIIRLENTSLFLFNAVATDSQILASGMRDYAVVIENSVFENSEIAIDSASNVTIVQSHFIMEHIGKDEVPNHVVKVYNTGTFFMSDTHFGNQSEQNNPKNTSHSEKKNSTNLGIQLKNVRNAALRGSTFTGIKGEKSNGSVMLLKNTEIWMESCQLYHNMAKNGVIFGNNSVNITSINSSFTMNHAANSGAVFYLINSCSLKNDGSVFQNNSAREHAGVVYAMYTCIYMPCIYNRRCLFQHNSAETGGGSVFWIQYNCQLINEQVFI